MLLCVSLLTQTNHHVVIRTCIHCSSCSAIYFIFVYMNTYKCIYEYMYIYIWEWILFLWCYNVILETICLFMLFTLSFIIVEKKNSRPITNWHVTLPSPQNTVNYKVPRIATRFCYHYSETNINLPSVMQKTNHTSTRVSDDTSGLAHVSDDIGGPIKLWHVSPIRLCQVSLTHPQTPINRSLPKAFEETKIQK